MTTPQTMSPALRRKLGPNAGRNNQPDPRPLTDYTADYSEHGGNSRVTITLKQPCIVRGPKWTLLDGANGEAVAPASLTVVSNTTFYFDFTGLIDGTVTFVDVPFQDMQVQNFQGGFVRPGGQWFRKAS